jgi:hypothetical protein
MVAGEAGVQTAAAQYESFCLRCHGTAGDVLPEYRAANFHVEEGMQCEHCHGPGEHYAKEDVMKDRKRAMEAGLQMPKLDMCLTCHNPKPSHAKLKAPAFDVKAAWERIKHPLTQEKTR